MGLVVPTLSNPRQTPNSEPTYLRHQVLMQVHPPVSLVLRLALTDEVQVVPDEEREEERRQNQEDGHGDRDGVVDHGPLKQTRRVVPQVLLLARPPVHEAMFQQAMALQLTPLGIHEGRSSGGNDTQRLWIHVCYAMQNSFHTFNQA